MHDGWSLLDQYSQSEFGTEGPFPSKQIERPFQSAPFYLSEISIMYAYIAYINHKFIFFLKGQESTCHEQKPGSRPQAAPWFGSQNASLAHPLKNETSAVMDGTFTFTRFGFWKSHGRLSHWDQKPPRSFSVLFGEEHAGAVCIPNSYRWFRCNMLCWTACVKEYIQLSIEVQSGG